LKSITSKDNIIYKETRKLSTKKGRDESGLYLVEGENMIQEALEHEIPLRHILVRDKGGGVPHFVFTKPGKAPGLPIFLLDQRLFDQLAQTETSQGVLGVAEKPMNQKALPKEGNVLVLDRLQDPGNIGTLIRTAEAAGYEGVVILKGTVDVFSPKVVRATAGSLFRIPLFHYASKEDLVEALRKTGKRIITTDLTAKTMYYQERLQKNIALVIGNEGNGVDPYFREHGDVCIKIPMKGKVDSLNAAVAASILMYESMRK
jgi:TrmH family RNA methyltransferase